MRNPTKRQVQKVIDIFETVQKLADNNLENPVDMREGQVFTHCGSPMCHAGWFEAALQKSKNTTNYSFTNYEHGAQKMAEILGFKSKNDLEMWAHYNPDIWGNQNGSFMFSFYGAFEFKNGNKPKRFTLRHIISHWKKVQKRLPR